MTHMSMHLDFLSSIHIYLYIYAYIFRIQWYRLGSINPYNMHNQRQYDNNIWNFMYVSSLCILLSLAMMCRKRRRKRYSVTVSRKRIGIVYSRGACVLGGACARSVCLDPPCHTARSTRVNSGSDASAASCGGNRSAARWSCLNSLSPTTGLITRGRGGGQRSKDTAWQGIPPRRRQPPPPRRRDDPCLSTVWIFDPAQIPVRTWVSDWCRARYPDAISEQSQKTQNICITFIQRWTNVEDVGPTLYKCYTNVLCLLTYKAKGQ